MKNRLLMIVLLAHCSVFALAGGGGGGGGGGGHSGSGGRTGLGRGPQLHLGGSFYGKALVILAVLGLSGAVYFRTRKFRTQRKAEAFLAGTRSRGWKKAELVECVKNRFLEIQAAWSERNLSVLKSALETELYLQWKIRLETMEARRQRNRIGQVTVESIDIVNVKDFLDDDKDEFIAEIRFAARESVADSRTVADNQIEGATEFWTLKRAGKKWKVKEVMASGVLADISLALDQNIVE